MIDLLSREFESVNFGDKRLDKRLKDISKGLALKSHANISSAFSTWKEIKGAYRLLNNDLVSPEKILAPHIIETVERCNHQSIVLAVQDTTFLDFVNRPKTCDLDLLQRKSKGSSGATGLILHNMLALDTHGNPLGLLNQEFVDRKTFRQESLKSLPLEKKESFRWVKNLHLETLKNLTPKVIHVADREADFFQFFEAALAAKESFVIRANVNRSIDIGSDDLAKLFKFTTSQAALGAIAIKVQVNASQKYRTAHLDIKSSKIKLDAL